MQKKKITLGSVEVDESGGIDFSIDPVAISDLPPEGQGFAISAGASMVESLVKASTEEARTKELGEEVGQKMRAVCSALGVLIQA
ncbi:MAG: hypothetical protein WCK82_08325 [Bacteroidota bacterium]